MLAIFFIRVSYLNFLFYLFKILNNKIIKIKIRGFSHFHFLLYNESKTTVCFYLKTVTKDAIHL